MKFKLTNDSIIKETECGIQLINKKYNTDISLSMSLNNFDELLNGKLLKQNQLKEAYNLIYILLNQKIIESVNTYYYKDKILNVKSCLIEITDSCNFKCPHCYVDKCHINKIGLADIKKIAIELKKLNCNMITLTGGEVLTNDEFITIYEYLYKQGFIIGINTNGFLFNKFIIQKLSQMPPYVIEISLYGYNKESYDSFTKTVGAFDRIIENIKKLKENGFNLILKNVITNSNKDVFNKIRQLAKQLEVEFRSDYIAFPQVNGKREKNPEQISVEDVIQSLKMQPNANEYFINLYNNYQQDNGFVFKCKTDDDSIFINSKLEVSMCICMQSYSIKYTGENLTDIVCSLQDFRKLKFDKNAKCYGCRLMSICRYCPGKFKLETGSYQNPPSWFCEYANKIFENFIHGVHFIRKKFLSNNDFNKLFEIIKTNVNEIGISVSEKDKDLWINNLKQSLTDNNLYFYVIYNNGEISGFVELTEKDNQLTVSEIQFSELIKHSKYILHTIKFILSNQEFKRYNKVKFNINKNNAMSIKTFLHLGAVKLVEKEKSNIYEIERQQVIQYLTKQKFI